MPRRAACHRSRGLNLRVLVTGAAGFVGRPLVRELATRHQVTALDIDCSGLQGLGVRIVQGDLAEPSVQREAAQSGYDAIVHLATLPGGACEQDPALGWRVNIDGSFGLIEAVLRSSQCPRVIFASSIAALGNELPATVTDETPLRPQMLYGAHKAMFEQWLAALSRRGALNALSLRLPGIVARPAGPSGMISAFMSEVFHAGLAGRRVTPPVSPEATMWLMSVRTLVANFRHALESDAAAEEPYALTLPAVRTTMAALAEEVSRQTGADPELVDYAPVPAVEAAFGRYPPLETRNALDAGFVSDVTVETLVRSALAQIGEQ